MKTKTCKHCKATFTPEKQFQTVCNPQCAYGLVRSQAAAKAKRAADKQARDERRQLREARERVKTRGQHLKEAQAAFNAYIRERDAGLPCISCGRHHNGQYHAGHYRTVGSCPELRFDEFNCHKQCAPCNNHLSGNLIEYRKGLIAKIGLAKVEWLEGPHAPAKLTIEQIKAIKTEYRARVRNMKKAA